MDDRQNGRTEGDDGFWCRKEGADKLVILVHGLRGHVVETWGRTPDLICSATTDCDVWPFGYSSHIARFLKTPDVDAIARSLLDVIELHAPNYQHFILVGHSLGGLVIQSAITYALRNGLPVYPSIGKVSHVVLYAPPLAGNDLVTHFRLFRLMLSDQVIMLAPANSWLLNLQNAWVNNVYRPQFPPGQELHQLPIPMTIVTGADDRYVPHERAILVYDTPRPVTVPGDHKTLKLPVNEADARFRVLHDVLTSVDFQPLPVYRRDIAKLQARTQDTLLSLTNSSQIRVGATVVTIVRDCASPLREAGENGSLVVVGDPGSGKSGLLHDLVQRLRREGLDVLYVAADRLNSRSLGGLRSEMNLDHEVVEILGQWPGSKPAYLVIDGLDVTRLDSTAGPLRDLIDQLMHADGRWRVAVSIRKYDLRYSTDLQRLFAGTPPTAFKDEEFARVRHVNVPSLTSSELQQLAQQSSTLYRLVVRAGTELEALLHVAFNLRLVGDLLGEGVAVDTLTPIRTQAELFDRYWLERIIRTDSHGHAREAILRRVINEMVAHRSLQADTSVIAHDVASSQPLSDLLSTQVLVEQQRTASSRPQRETVVFAHALLFDYAVARLLLRGSHDAFLKPLEAARDVILFMQPSVTLHFNYLWSLDADRITFWDAVFAAIRSHALPAIGKLIGPTVAAMSITQPRDYDPLVVALHSTDPRLRETAVEALRYLVGSILIPSREPQRPLVGPDAPPWSDLLEKTSDSLDQSTAFVVRTLLRAMVAM